MEGRIVKLKDFANECGVTDRAIQKHLQTLAKELEGHFERRGVNGTWLDDVAIQAIRARMVTPPPPVVSDGRLVQENEELRRALMELQGKYIALQEKMIEQAALVAEAEAGRRLLDAAETHQELLSQELREEKEKAEQAARVADEERKKVEQAAGEARAATERAVKAEQAAAEAVAALEAIRNRKLSFRERLLGILHDEN